MSDDSVDVNEAAIGDIHVAMEAGELTATALVRHYLQRIDYYNDALDAIIYVNPAACERASHLDAEFDASGPVGPLHAVPVIVKDNQATHDLPTSAGSTAYANFVPRRDATIVKRIRDAGGIIIAKANLQELAFGVDTVSSLGGETRNPYSLGHRPGGSSGGTAAAIAANLGMVGTGTDTCSSVRSPPAFNNLVGLRPTMGLVSRAGIFPMSLTQDTPGPVTRTVEDAARLMDVLAGYDPSDPVTATGVNQVPKGGYTEQLMSDGLTESRIGVIREFFELGEVAPDHRLKARGVRGVIDVAIEDMRAEGATVVDPVSFPHDDLLMETRVVGFEFKRDFNGFLDDWVGDGVPLTMTALVESGEVHPWICERIREQGILDVDVEALDGNVEYLQRLAKRETLRTVTLARMADEDLDALLYPPSTITPVAIPERQPFREMRCQLAAHTGLPAIVVPAGFASDGLPVGLELLGRPFAEPRLFELAYAFEQATRHREAPAEFGPVDRADTDG